MRPHVPPAEWDLRRRPVFVITMDTDWCPVEVMDYVLCEIVDRRLPLTVFATGEYGKAVERPGTEIALHYNVENTSFTESFRKIAESLPGARGARGHSLAVSERLRASWSYYNIAYDSSSLMYLQHDIVPFPIARGVLELPIYFMDMFALEYEQDDLARFPDENELFRPGLKVFDFHPVHLLLNTPSCDYYFEKKQWYHDFNELLKNQYHGYGIRSYFDDVQRWILRSAHVRTTCLELSSSLPGSGQRLRQAS